MFLIYIRLGVLSTIYKYILGHANNLKKSLKVPENNYRYV